MKRSTYRKWTPEEIATLRDLMTHALTYEQIAKHLHALGYPVSVCVIHRRIREMPRAVRKEVVANAHARRARLKSLNARRERARKRQQEVAA